MCLPPYCPSSNNMTINRLFPRYSRRENIIIIIFFNFSVSRQLKPVLLHSRYPAAAAAANLNREFNRTDNIIIITFIIQRV